MPTTKERFHQIADDLIAEGVAIRDLRGPGCKDVNHKTFVKWRVRCINLFVYLLGESGYHCWKPRTESDKSYLGVAENMLDILQGIRCAIADDLFSILFTQIEDFTIAEEFHNPIPTTQQVLHQHMETFDSGDMARILNDYADGEGDIIKLLRQRTKTPR